MSAILNHIIEGDREIYQLKFKDTPDRRAVRIHDNGKVLKILEIRILKVNKANNAIIVEIVKDKDDAFIIPKAGEKLSKIKA